MDTSSQTANHQVEHILWETYIKRGQQALSMKRAAEAKSMFQLALNKLACFGDDDWRQVETIRWIALACIENRHYKEAEDLLSKLLVVLFGKWGPSSPEVLEALRFLSEVCEKQLRYTQAAKLMLHVIEHHPQKGTQNPEFLSLRRKYYSLVEKTKAESVLDDGAPYLWGGRA